ncbi:MAG: hypothetical protein WB660_01780 [Candidatus Sulfotelmatobacter sp.]
MLDALGIETHPGWSAEAIDMSEFFSLGAGSVVINSPLNYSTHGPSLLVNAAASEFRAQVDHMEVWDEFNGKSIKLGSVYAKAIDRAFVVSGNGLHQMTIKDVGDGPRYPTLHQKITNYTVSPDYGVFVNTPANNSTQGRLVPLSAFAVEPQPRNRATALIT